MKRLLILGLSLFAAVTYATPPTGPLPRSVVPLHYHLDLAIDPEQAGFDGEVAIEVEVRTRVSRIWLHGRGLEIREVHLEREGHDPLPLRAQAELAEIGGVLALDAPVEIEPGRATVRIAYAARFDTRLEGTYVVERDGKRYVMTQMQPIGARQSFPSFDEPAFKTPWDVTIRARHGQRVVANSALDREEKLDDGWVRHVFRTTQPLPSYLIAYGVGPWDIVERAPLPPSAQRDRELPLRGIAAAGRGGEMAYALARTQVVIEALEEYFDLAYPYDKLDILAAPDFAAGAMENVGLILYREALLFVDADTPPDALRAFYQVHAHELAHQWFGNLVTMPWWDDLWLNEAFATWMAAKIIEQIRPDLGARRAYRARVFSTMSADSLATVRRIAEPVEDWRDIESAFDGITYAKGGGVLQMFETWLGENTFRDAVRDYVRKHAHGSARGGDLVAALAARSDAPDVLAAAFRSFIRQPGVPELGVRLICGDGRARIEVTQSRYLPLGSDASADQAWSLPLCIRGGRGDEVWRHCAMLAAEPVQTVDLPQGSGCPEWLIPNAQGSGYFRFHLEANALDALAARTPLLDDAEMQAFADTMEAALRAGSVSLGGWLRATAPLSDSSLPEVALAPARTMRWLNAHVFTGEPGASLFRHMLYARYSRALQAVGRVPVAGEPVARRQLRLGLLELLAVDAKVPLLRAELLAKARRAFVESDMDGFAGLGADHRGLALRVLIEDGEPAEFHQLIERLHDSRDPRLRRDLLQALGHTRLPELRLQALELSLSPAIASGEIRSLLGPIFEDPSGAAQAQAWFDLNEDTVLARLPGFSQSRVPGLYAASWCSAEQATQLESRFGERMARTEGGPRAMSQAVERVRLCAALRDGLLEN